MTSINHGEEDLLLETQSQTSKGTPTKLAPSKTEGDSTQQTGKKVDLFAGIVFPKLCDVFDQIRQGNFLPLLALMQLKPDMDYKHVDQFGFAPVHYAVSNGNLQALEAIHSVFPDSLNCLSQGWQTPVMIAANYSNPKILKFLVERISTMRLEEVDQWGFCPLAYCIRSNFIAGFFYLISKGAKLDKNFKDRSGNTLAHLAAYGDRKFLLQVLLRAGVDMTKENSQKETPFETALNNWSLQSVHFFLDFSSKPFRTLDLLSGGDTKEYFLLPDYPVQSIEDLRKSSRYLPSKIRAVNKIKSVKEFLSSRGKSNALALGAVFSAAGFEYLKNYWATAGKSCLLRLGKSRSVGLIPAVLLVFACYLFAVYSSTRSNSFNAAVFSIQSFLIITAQLCRLPVT